eukprot:365122-Chlamydomonas_euryale.AAC.49
MINAGSTLHLTVYNKANLTSNVLNTINVFNKKKGVDRDKVRAPVADLCVRGACCAIFGACVLGKRRHGTFCPDVHGNA